MEAVPRLHMLWFALKSSPEGTSFQPLKKFIADSYNEDPNSYSKEIFALETLRNQAMRMSKDSCNMMKRYYSQLYSLHQRLPQLAERGLIVFTWKDLYHSNVQEITDLRYEMAAVLFNIGASHTQIGASVTRGDVDGMKKACTHFQCAAWAFTELHTRYKHVNGGTDFSTPELLVFMQQVSFAQAQECILEKSLLDNRKPNIVAKVTAQIVTYYGAALAALLTGGSDSPVQAVVDSSVYKLWKKYVRFKISYLHCILYLYQGQHAEEQQKMGERVTLYQAAWDKLEEARTESKGLPDQKEISESLIFTADVVEAKRKNAKNENEFIYHEAIPELSDIAAVQGANLVNGISFSVIDPDVIGEDIFAKLVPLKAHEASSMYSEEKANLLRKYGTMIEEKNIELAGFMKSLTLDNLNVNEEKANKVPQGIVDRCAALNANKNAIPDLISAMSQLAEICTEVESNLNEITTILAEEEQQEENFQRTTGVNRTPNAHITELNREYQKYYEAHSRAGESNDTLRKAMELHVNNLKILARPLAEIQQAVPKLSSELNTTELFKEVKLILNKVNEMKAQRSQFHADLRIAVNADDITEKVIAHGSEEGLQLLFNNEIAKHNRITQLIDQNLIAQKNILQALMESYAKAAPILKTLGDVKHKRDNFFSSLAASYDVYEDLLAKSAKGLEFYKKLSGNVQKLLTRLKSARDVQSEDRQQRLKISTTSSNVNDSNTAAAPIAGIPTIMNSVKFPNTPSHNQRAVDGDYSLAMHAATSTTESDTPKLRDYLLGRAMAKSSPLGGSGVAGDMNLATSTASRYLPSVRPNPLGSENPTQVTCPSVYRQPLSVHPSAGYMDYGGGPSVPGPNEPPPPYTLQQQQHQQLYQGDPASGYTNPMYQKPAMELAPPPAYKPLASPTSQFPYNMQNLAADMTNWSLQGVNNGASGGSVVGAYGSTVSGGGALENKYSNLSQPQARDFQGIPPANQHLNYQMTTMSQQQPHVQMNALLNASLSSYQNPQTSMMPLQQPIHQQQAMQQQQQLQQQILTQQQHITQQQQSLAQQHTLPSQPMPQQPMPLQQSIPLQQIQQQPMTNQQMEKAPNASVCSQNVTDTTRNTYSPYNGSSTKHPGYSYNPQTRTYEYGSGFQQGIADPTFYGQYTSASNDQNSQTSVVGAANAAAPSEYNTPIVSHVKPSDSNVVSAVSHPTDDIANAATSESQYSYYTTPYGYQSQCTPHSQYGGNPMELGHVMPSSQPQSQQKQQHSIYMQSGSANIAPTHTTGSGNNQYVSSSQQQQQPTPQLHAQPADTATAKAALVGSHAKKGSASIDLLTDIDFSGMVPPPMLPAPALKPVVVGSGATPPPSIDSPMSTDIAADVEKSVDTKPEQTAGDKGQNLTHSSQSPIPANRSQSDSEAPDTPAATGGGFTRKTSFDNLSICSDLSSLDMNFDWESASLATAATNATAAQPTRPGCFTLTPIEDPFKEEKTLKYFHKEVERYERVIETLNVKMLNGDTQLSAKWKELNATLDRETSKRTTNIAKLFPEKNRSLDCLPYDHARVKLDKDTDDYINAARIKNLGNGCPNLIIAQAPLQNTLNDFWSMAWSEKTRTMLCLHTPTEMLDPFWPHVLESQLHFDDFTVKCIDVNTSWSHCTEYKLKLSLHENDAIIDMSILQIKAWTKGLYPQIIGIASNALQVHQHNCLEFNTPISPLIINCLNGSDRCELTAVALCAIQATKIQRPVLLNVIDVWLRLCTHRQNAARDSNIVEQSMQIVLNHAHDVLNKHGIMTSYQMKIAPQVTSKEKEDIKDPLNELDPLWKLK